MYSDTINTIEQYASVLRICATFLPVIWVLFVFTEWWMLRKHYRYFRIDHSYRPNYKIAFDPRYLLSLFFTIVIWICLQLLGHYDFYLLLALPICLLFYGTAELSVFLSSQCTKPFFSGVKPIVNDEWVRGLSFSEIMSRYEKSVEEIKKVGLVLPQARGNLKWLRIYQRMRAMAVRLLISVVVTMVLLECTTYLPEELGDMWRVVLFAFLCPVIHSYMFKLYTPNFYDKDFVDFDYVRVFEEDNKTYVILAPTTYDSNTIGVAVRAVVCRSGDGFIVTYLIHEDYKTLSVPYSGKFVRVNVDLVGRIAPENKDTFLLPNYMIKELMKKMELTEYMSNGGWKSIEQFN